MIKRFSIAAAAAAFLFCGSVAAVPVGLGAFSGGEFLETFNGEAGGARPNPWSFNGLTYTSADTWAIQPGTSLFDNIPGASLAPTLNTGSIGDFIIDFSSAVNRVGLLLSSGGSPTASWNMTVFGAGLVALETVSVSQPALSDAVFAGIERSETIVRLGVTRTGGGTGFFTFLDDVRAEQVAAVPVPGTALLLVSGLVGLAARRRSRPS